MDFSSITRALDSLQRRSPPQEIRSVVEELRAVFVVDVSSSTTKTTATVSTSSKIVKWLQALMGFTSTDDSLTPRWEALAVGLYIATELIQQQHPPPSTTINTTAASTTNKNTKESKFSEEASNVSITTNGSSSSIIISRNHPVYMDGPRVPTTTTSTTTTTTITTSQHNGNDNDNGAVALRRVNFTTFEILPLLRTMHHTCRTHLEHSEPRVRTLVAKAVGAYSAQIMHQLQRHYHYHHHHCHTLLDDPPNDASIDVDDVVDNDDTTTTTPATTAPPTTTDLELQTWLEQMHHTLLESIDRHIRAGRGSPIQAPVHFANQAPETAETATAIVLVDDTTGWRAMETNWFCLASFIHGLSDQYCYMFPWEDVDKTTSTDTSTKSTLYTQFTFSAIQHVNRHVRAAAMQAYEQLIHAITLSIIQHQDDNLKRLLSEPTSVLRTTLIDIVKTGLADNWSQVRMASSVLCRVWFQSLRTLQISIQEPIMMSALLPRMCLNRFYSAHGVKFYSHETWKIIFGSTTSNSADVTPGTSGSLGLQLVAENINAMIRYYIKMCDADNHAVREAACQAIAELAVKVGTHEQYRHTVLDDQQIQNFIAVLLMCFYDESWPVRDEACVACGVLCKAFPQACHSEIFQKTLWSRIAEQVTDQIWSVRENAAVAIGDILEAYGDEILPKVQSLITILLPSARDQPSMSASEYKAYVNELKQSTDNQRDNSGSVAAKLRKSGHFDCVDCYVDRPKAPWEATDGCIYLIREYVVRRTVHGSAILISDDELIPLCTELADVCRVRHFPQSDELRSTLWKCLPMIAAALGKQRFKNRYLDIFMELLVSNLESSSASQLSVHAAGQCAEELAFLIGMNMFRARLEDHTRRIFDQMVQARQMMPKGLTGGSSDVFSPFGPPDVFAGMIPP